MRVDGSVALNVQITSGEAPAASVAGPNRPSGEAQSSRAALLVETSPLAGAWARPGVAAAALRLVEIAAPALGYATAAPRAASTAEPKASTAKSPLDFLRDSRLSAEEKLVLLLAQQQKDTEKEIDTVLKKAEAKSKKKTSVAKSLNPLDAVKSSLSSLDILEKLGVGRIVSLLSAVSGVDLSQITGSMLGAAAVALGMPHLAPAAIALGTDLAKALESTGEPKAASDAPPNAGTGSSNALDPVETQRLTLLVNRQQQWSSTVSNLLHSLHQTRMGVIQNLR